MKLEGEIHKPLYKIENRGQVGQRVRQLTLDGKLVRIYTSAKEAAKVHKVHHCSITKVCRHGGTVRGFLWEYGEKRFNPVKKLDKNGKVLKTYKNTKEVAEELGVLTDSVSAAARTNGKKLLKGFYWRYSPINIKIKEIPWT